ncbi:MAG: cysteine--tRNA ligase [Candidatus Pacebacteria bacterium]|nr:cysteine--tRNA ligase [Candidatus Paceibacterota bacterium]
MKLYNTASRKIEEFKPLHPPDVSFYSCGPTVYDYTHIGHLRTYINNDVLKRFLQYLGYKMKHVMNITDVGHLTGDGDEGEDKMEKGAAKKGATVWDLAKVYTDYFLYSIDALNIKRPDVFSNATGHIPEFIDLIKILEKKGFAYETKEAVYFDVSKFKNYGKLSGQKLAEKKIAVREEVHADPGKKNPADFALWFKAVGRFKNHIMRWPSPWGDGFPGWHIECSAMCMKYLGDTVDVHAGGVDHIPVHHENEIAQSEAATGRPFVKYWFHNEFLLVNGQKMSKSLENFYTVDDIKKKNINPMALRLLFLQTHYRQIMNFTWESLSAAETALKKIKNAVAKLKEKAGVIVKMEDYTDAAKKLKNKFTAALEDDLQAPQALAVLWEALKSDIYPTEKLSLILEFDQVLGLDLEKAKEEKITVPPDILEMADEREKARKMKDFRKSDELRRLINQKGYDIEDTAKGPKISKK